MDTTARKRSFLTIDEYAALPDGDDRTELVRGRVIREPQPSYQHARVQVRVGATLDLLPALRVTAAELFDDRPARPDRGRRSVTCGGSRSRSRHR